MCTFCESISFETANFELLKQAQNQHHLDSQIETSFSVNGRHSLFNDDQSLLNNNIDLVSIKCNSSQVEKSTEIIQQHEHKWELLNLSKYVSLCSRIESLIEIESAYFALPINENVQFKLKLIICSKKVVSIRVISQWCCDITEIEVQFVVSLLNQNEQKCQPKRATKLFTKENNEFEFENYSKWAFLKNANSNFLANDILSLCIELNVHFSRQQLIDQRKFDQFVIDDFASPWHCKRICDVQTRSQMQTDLQIHHGSHLWTIADFLNVKSFSPFEPFVINFPPFQAENYDKIQLALQLFPNEDGVVKMNVIFHSTEVVNVMVQFRLALLNKKMVKVNEIERQFQVLSNRITEWKEFAIARKDIQCIDKQLLHEGKDLLIVCDTRLHLDPISTSIDLSATTVMSPLNHVLVHQQPTNLVFVFNSTTTLHAHKAILSARSTFFRAMFSYENEENQQNRMTVNYIEVDVFKELLRYIYTSKVSKMNELASELLIASDMYGLIELKTEVEEYISSTMTTEKAIHLLQFAEFYSAKTLHLKAKQFIAKQYDTISKTVEFQEFVKAKPETLIQLYRFKEVEEIGQNKHSSKPDFWVTFYEDD